MLYIMARITAYRAILLAVSQARAQKLGRATLSTPQMGGLHHACCNVTTVT